MIPCKERRKRNKLYGNKVKLVSYYNSKGVNVPLKNAQVTKVLQHHANLLWHENGVDPKEYSTRSLRAGSAMALILGGCDDSIINLVGQWHSVYMIEYLQQATLPIYKQLSSKILDNGGHSSLQIHLLLFINFLIHSLNKFFSHSHLIF